MKLNYQKKMEMVTELRERVYGKKATTGRVQRVWSVITLKDLADEAAPQLPKTKRKSAKK